MKSLPVMKMIQITITEYVYRVAQNKISHQTICNMKIIQVITSRLLVIFPENFRAY